MPTPYIKKLAKKHHTSVGKSEGKWAKAKAVAKNLGKGENFAYITSIYKKMMGESVSDMSLKDFLIFAEGIEGASEIAYGGEKDDIEDVEDVGYGAADDDEFDLRDEEGLDDLEGDEFDGEEDFGDAELEGDGEDHQLVDILSPEELDGDEEDSDNLDDNDEFRLRENSPFGMMKSLMLITEKKQKKTLKKAAKSVYHRDYVKTKNKPYRKYDPKAREHEAASESFLDDTDPLNEKWAHEYTVPESKKGMFKGRNKAELEAELQRPKDSGPHKEGSKEYTKMKELNFAIRAKSGWD